MSRRRAQENQANQYDKIFRENMEAALPGIIGHIIGLDIVHSEEIPMTSSIPKSANPTCSKK